MNTIQGAIDRFLLRARLKTVVDAIYYKDDEIVVVLRKAGHRNVSVDVSQAASPSEVVETIASHLAVY